MKTKLNYSLFALVLLTFSIIGLQPFTTHAQGTAFTYQGRLNDGSAPANGNYDLQFTLFNTNQFGFPAALILTNAAVPVNNGLFTTTLDFGSGVFTGSNLWVELSVRTNGNGAFTTLAPRQPITPTPYAITAANLAGVVENNAIDGGAALATISGGGGNAIQSGANNSTIGGGGFNTIQSGADHSTISGGYSDQIQGGAWESFIGGGQGNIIGSNAVWSAIGGGLNNVIQPNASYSAIFGGFGNTLYSQYSFIGGGYINTIQTNAVYSTIAGGVFNTIQTNSFYSAIDGGDSNTIQTNSQVSVIGGGDSNTIQGNAGASVIGGGVQNNIQINAGQSTIAGGIFNTIQMNAGWSTIAGGNNNMIQAGAQYGFMGGGYLNAIQTNASYSIIGGGHQNNIQSNAYDSIIAGGAFNTVETNAFASTIGGGIENTNGGVLSTIPGGYKNVAGGDYSFAAGQQAQARHQGAFVWSDSQGAPFASTANDQFLIRAAGGVGINNSNPNGASLYVSGNRSGGTFNSSVGIFENTSTATGSTGSGPALRVVVDGGSCPAGALNVSDNGTGPIAEFGNGITFVCIITNDGTIYCKGAALTSDRNAKENFTALDGKTVLAKVLSIPVTEWNYKDDAADKKHIGPVAQDFHEAFDLNGSDDKHISVVDEGGVALAAIQGLNQKVEEKDSEIQNLKQENSSLEKRLSELEAEFKLLAAGK